MAHNFKQLVIEAFNENEQAFNNRATQAGVNLNVKEERQYIGKMLMANSPKLRSWGKQEVAREFLRVADWGLSADPSLGYVYFETRSGRIELGYKGAIAILARYDNIVSITCELVHENDEFTSGRKDEAIEHRITSLRDAKRGEIDGGYAQVRYTDNTVYNTWVTGEELDAHRGNKNGVYRGAYYKQMLKKAVILRLYRELKDQVGFTTQDQKMARIDEMLDDEFKQDDEQENGGFDDVAEA